MVSVIVPVLGDSRLALCLEALERQTYPAERFEVLVVENGPAGQMAVVCEPFGRVRLLHEPARGSYAARNRGAGTARGQILAFTDADCVPDSGWIDAGVACLHEHPDAHMVGGEVELFPLDRTRMTAAEVWECAWGFPQEEFVRDKHFAATANLFVTREAFEAVGPFDARLMSSGDVEWGRRARAGGRHMVFSPEARVAHPARRRIRHLAEKYARTCGGQFELRRLQGQGHAAAALKLLKKPLRSLARSDLDHSPAQHARYVGVEAVLSAVQLAEMARLSLGGRPRRR